MIYHASLSSILHTTNNYRLMINAFFLFIRLATGTFSKRPDFDKPKNRFKFFLRGLLTFPYTLKWLYFLDNLLEYKEFLYETPRLATKLHRPYIFSYSSLKERLQILTSHYLFQRKVFSPALQQLLLSLKSFELVSFIGKNDNEYKIILRQNLILEKEGELYLQLNVGENSLCTISFCFYETPHGVAILIGGLQGSKHEDYNLIKEATKSCYGLFPKKILFEALMTFGDALGINVIHAVSNEAHIFKHWRYNKEIFADYDSFWLELGARKIDKRLFEFTEPVYHKPVEMIESKKRSEHKKRQLLLSEIKEQIKCVIASQVLNKSTGDIERC